MDGGFGADYNMCNHKGVSAHLAAQQLKENNMQRNLAKDTAGYK